jgi:hypothetical protein
MNRIKIIKTTAFCLFLLVSTTLFSQTRIWSPYSRYGLGELTFARTPYLNSMGGTSMAFRKPGIINYSNPASYSNMRNQSFVFEAGFQFAPRILETDDMRETATYSSMSHLQFAFPITQKIGVSIGLLPYSNIGYKMKNQQEIDSVGTVEYTYEGWGGLNTFYVGTGIEIFKGFSAGFNMNYYFGNIERKRIAVFDTTGFTNSRITNKVNISDVNLNFGIQYQKRFEKPVESTEEKETYILTLGVSGGNTSTLNARENILAVHFAGNNPFAVPRDTVYEYNDQNNTIVMPMSYGGGIFFEKENKWMLGADVLMQQWDEFKYMGVQDSLRNSMRISFGGAIMPSADLKKSMFHRSTWLFGAHYYTNYLELKNTALNQYGISFGIAMPVRRTATMIQLSFEVGKTGTTENSLIEETYGKINIGVSISERWFSRKKYD